MDVWVEICQVEDIPARGARVVARDGAVPIAVFRTAGDAVFALLDRCPHRGGPLSQGLVTGSRVVCPLHGWTVDLGSGVAAAPDEGCTQAFDVDVQGGCVRLRRQDLVVPAKAGTQRLEGTSGNTLVVPAKAGTQRLQAAPGDTRFPRSPDPA